MPEIQTVLQRFPFVRTGKVDDHGRAATQCGAAAGIKIVGGRRVADVEIKMRVCVDKTGEEQLAGNIYDLRAAAGKARSDCCDLLSVDEDVSGLTARGVDHGAAAKYFFHTRQLLL